MGDTIIKFAILQTVLKGTAITLRWYICWYGAILFEKKWKQSSPYMAAVVGWDTLKHKQYADRYLDDLKRVGGLLVISRHW